MIIFRTVLGVLRLLAFTLVVVLFLISFSIHCLITGYTLQKALKMRRRFIRVMLPILGVVVDIKGSFPDDPYLIMSNHRSYGDPAATLIKSDALPVAKADIRNWPILSWGFKLTGVLFVQRDVKESRRAVREAVKNSLLGGISIYVCPEGTTHMEPKTIDFRPGTFQVAANNGVQVVPVAIEYENPNDAWVGNATFIPHFVHTFGKWRTRVSVRIGPTLIHDDWESLLAETKAWIDDTLTVLRKQMRLPLVAEETRTEVSSN